MTNSNENPPISTAKKDELREAIEAGQDKYTEEIAAYEKLVSLIEEFQGGEHLFSAANKSLAFIVEKIKAQHPDNWLQTFDEFIANLRKQAEAHGYSGISWGLREFVDEHYAAHLEKCVSTSTDDNERENCAFILERLKLKSVRAAELKAEGKPVIYAGVNIDHTPDWYMFVQTI